MSELVAIQVILREIMPLLFPQSRILELNVYTPPKSVKTELHKTVDTLANLGLSSRTNFDIVGEFVFNLLIEELTIVRCRPSAHFLKLWTRRFEPFMRSTCELLSVAQLRMMLPSRLGGNISSMLLAAVTLCSPVLFKRVLEAFPDISHHAGTIHIVEHMCDVFEELRLVKDKKSITLSHDLVFPLMSHREEKHRVEKAAPKEFSAEQRAREELELAALIRIAIFYFGSVKKDNLCYSGCALLRFACAYGFLEIVEAFFERMDQIYLTYKRTFKPQRHIERGLLLAMKHYQVPVVEYFRANQAFLRKWVVGVRNGIDGGSQFPDWAKSMHKCYLFDLYSEKQQRRIENAKVTEDSLAEAVVETSEPKSNLLIGKPLFPEAYTMSISSSFHFFDVTTRKTLCIALITGDHSVAKDILFRVRACSGLIGKELLIRLALACDAKSLRLLLTLPIGDALSMELGSMYRYGRHKRFVFANYLVNMIVTENRYYYPEGPRSFYAQLKEKYRTPNLKPVDQREAKEVEETPIDEETLLKEKRANEVKQAERERVFQKTAEFLRVLLAAYPSLSTNFTMIPTREMIDSRYWKILTPLSGCS